eukprot:TRINITY_DN31680_c0_g1_i1.p1 TRINITY_DN31680_c0_g1~~TRINITY_DN31680_c0_g1_i1.p1  ORF type:complete len:302 (+),score=64.88 TRINITY_DN31680_c0_g1_i1:23-907(+)
MATATLSHRYVFGLAGKVSGNAAFMDAGTVVYVAGHCVVLHTIADRKQRFIPASEGGEGITATALCPSGRFVAIAEAGDRAVVSLYDLRTLRKRKSVAAGEGDGREILSVAFSHDSQLLLTLGGPPTWQLTIWAWAKARVVASASACEGAPHTPINDCSFSPLDTSLLCTTIGGSLRFYRFADNEVRAMPAPRTDGSPLFTAHCWLRAPSDCVVAGTETGALLLFRGGELLCTMDPITGSTAAAAAPAASSSAPVSVPATTQSDGARSQQCAVNSGLPSVRGAGIARTSLSANL